MMSISTRNPPQLHGLFDYWRIVAALMVVWSHAAELGLAPGKGALSGRIGHVAVIVFFVISGYSVASSSVRYAGVREFLIARLSRIYSVAGPAVILVLLLDLWVGPTQLSGYPEWQYRNWPAHISINLLFLGEVWGFKYRPFSIYPYWSLSYEVWYYLLFAAGMLVSAFWKRVLFVSILLVMGPKMLLLLPLWYLGVCLHKFETVLKWPAIPKTRGGETALIAGLAAGGLWISMGLDRQLQELSLEICRGIGKSSSRLECGYSQWFLADYVIGIGFFVLTAVLLWRWSREVPGLTPETDGKCSNEAAPRALQFVTDQASRAVSWAAPNTYSLYLLHYSLLLAGVNVFPSLKSSAWAGPFVVAVCVMALLLGHYFTASRSYWAGGVALGLNASNRIVKILRRGLGVLA